MKQQWTERLLTPRLIKALRQFPVVLVSGARQVGKTALCRHVWSEANYVSLDLPAEADSARSEPETFLQRHPTPLIVDEIQYAPELLRYMKAKVDQDKSPGQYLITGSQDFALMQGVTESLAGERHRDGESASLPGIAVLGPSRASRKSLATKRRRQSVRRRKRRRVAWHG